MRKYDKKQNILEANLRLELGFNLNKTTMVESVDTLLGIVTEDTNIGSLRLPGFWESCLRSESLTTLEKDTLRFVFTKVGIQTLNENVVGDVVGWFKEKVSGGIDWLKELGRDSIDAFKSGMKKIGAFFTKIKDALKSFWGKVKEFFAWIMKLAVDNFNSIRGKLDGLVNGWLNKGNPTEGSDGVLDSHNLLTDLENLMMCTSHIHGHWGSYIGDIVVKGMTDTSKLESNLESHLDSEVNSEIKEAFNHDVLTLVLEGDMGNLLMEGGDSLVDDIGDGGFTLKNFLLVILKAVQFIFNPIGKLVEEVTIFLSKNLFYGISIVSDVMGGPGPFKFSALGGILIGVLALLEGLHMSIGIPSFIHGIVDLLMSLIPGVGDIKHMIHFFHTVILGSLAAEVIVEIAGPLISKYKGGKDL